VFDLDVLDDMMVRCRPGLSGYLHELSPRVVEFRS